MVIKQLRYTILFLFILASQSLSSLAQEWDSHNHSNETLVPTVHPRTTGTGMDFPLESRFIYPEHTEGILGRYFPHIHGNEAVHLDYLYTGGIFNNSRGGLQTQSATSYVGIADVGITTDTEKLGLWKNGTFYVHSLFSHGPSPSRWIGDYQGASVFAYETPAQVSEYWYEHRFFNDKLILKGGKQDAGGDFFYLNSTADFINASFTCIPNTRIPTTPNNAWGLSTYFHLTDSVCFKAGLFDAQADANQFWMSESGNIYSAYQVEYHTSLFCGLPGFLYAGSWYDNSEFERFDFGETRQGNYGLSAGFEQMIYRTNPCQSDDLRGVSLFGQYGNAKTDRNEIDSFWSFGVTGLGLINCRPDDSIGIAVNAAHFSDGFQQAESLRYSHESAYELYYKIKLTKNCSIQPDFQYIIHTGGQYRDALVSGLVFQLVF